MTDSWREIIAQWRLKACFLALPREFTSSELGLKLFSLFKIYSLIYHSLCVAEGVFEIPMAETLRSEAVRCGSREIERHHKMVKPQPRFYNEYGCSFTVVGLVKFCHLVYSALFAVLVFLAIR